MGRVNFHLIWPICGVFQQDSALYFRVLPPSLHFISHLLYYKMLSIKALLAFVWLALRLILRADFLP